MYVLNASESTFRNGLRTKRGGASELLQREEVEV